MNELSFETRGLETYFSLNFGEGDLFDGDIEDDWDPDLEICQEFGV